MIILKSRHPSHKPFRKWLKNNNSKIGGYKKHIVIRLGSLTDIKRNSYPLIEINKTEGIRNSSDKRRMKKCFDDAKVSHAEWYTFKNMTNDGTLVFAISGKENRNYEKSISSLKFPIIVKHRFGSKGKGNYKLNTVAELSEFCKKHDMQKYILEKFYTYTKEYRLHVSKDGCFYACRKMIKNGTDQNKKWQRHNDNCVWIIETNPLFDKPSNWKTIVNDCIKCLSTLNLDFAAFDVKMQSSKNGNNYIILESNSAPSFGETTLERYKTEIEKIIKNK